MKIDEVEVSGQKFQVVSEKTISNTGIVWNYSVKINDVDCRLDVTVTSDIRDTLEIIGLDVNKELRCILLQEIRMEIFSKLHPEFHVLMEEYNHILEGCEIENG